MDPKHNYQEHKIEKTKNKWFENEILANQWDKWFNKSDEENASTNLTVSLNTTNINNKWWSRHTTILVFALYIFMEKW